MLSQNSRRSQAAPGAHRSFFMRALLATVLLPVGTLLSSSEPVRASDWNQYRGPARDNLSPETGLARHWPEGGPKLLQTFTGLGEAYSTVAVVADVIYTMGNLGDAEEIIALDARNGSMIWKTRSGKAYLDGTGNGPRGTPAVDHGKVYALGGNGDLTCCNAKSGQVHWQKNILQEFDGSNIVWGISESVLVHNGSVICSPGGSRGSVVALNPENGTTIWVSQIPGNPQASYASPMPMTVDGVEQYVVFTSKGVTGIRADDGKPMWTQSASANGTANCATPLIVGRQVFSSSDYGTGAELVELRADAKDVTATQVYFTTDMKNHHGGMVAVGGYVYGSSGNTLTCVDLSSGKATWRESSLKGSVICVDQKIVFRHENGDVVLFSARSDKFEELGRFSPPDRSSRPAWSHPVVADGRLYLRDQDKLQVYDLK